MTRYLYWDARSREEVLAELEARAGRTELEAEGDRLDLALELRDSGDVIGDVNLQWLSSEHRQGEIGFVLHPDHHGHGYAAEAALACIGSSGAATVATPPRRDCSRSWECAARDTCARTRS